MKKLHFITLAVAAALTAACSSTETVYEYVRLSDAACTFLASDNTQKSIEVTASGAWQADAGASWLTVERQDDYLLLAAADNDSGMERVTEIVITSGSATAGIKVIQMAPESTIYRYRVLKTFDMGAVMSKNGRYVGGNIKELLPDETWENYPTIIDLETDEWIQLGPYPNSLFNIELPFAISDEGTIFFLDANTSACVGFNLAGDYFLPANAEGHELLPSVQSISADGRIVYGTTWDNLDFGMVYWDEAGEVHYVGEDVRYCRPVERPDGHGGTFTYNLCDGMWTTATNTNVSPNGKYIAGTYRIESLSADGFEKNERNYPAFYNTETQKTVVFDDLPGGGALSATSDGLGFTADSTFGPSSGKVVDIENGIVLGSALEWIESTYGIRIPSGYITYMPDSKDRFLGAMLYTGGPVVEGINWYVGPAR